DMTQSIGVDRKGRTAAYNDDNVLDCFHPYDKIEQTDIDTIDPTFIINTGSAVKITNIIDAAGLLLKLDDANWYHVGQWFNIEIPYPTSILTQDEGGNSCNIGKKYGS